MTVRDVQKRVEAVLSRYTMKSGGPERYLTDNLMRFLKDAYDLVTDALRIPIATGSLVSVANQANYALPADCYDNFNGIVCVEYDGRPIDRQYLISLQEQYYEDWKNPPNYASPEWYIQYNNITELYLVPKPTEAGKSIVVTYVQETTEPVADTDVIPAFFDPFVPYVADYILGRILNQDKNGRGSMYLVAFKQEIQERKRRHKRQQARRPGREGLTLNFDNYRVTYGTRRQKP